MKTTADKLAAALRALQDTDGEFYAPTDAQADALRALLAEHENATAAPVTYRADGREYVGQEWDNGPQVWDVVRDDGDQWICLADPEHSARVVAALNAAATAAPARPTLRDAVADDPTRALVLRDALSDYAEAQYVAARNARSKNWPHGARSGEVYAQGCESRRRAALALLEDATEAR